MDHYEVTIEQLRAFITVAEEGNVGRAAARLSMTQPPLSRRIQKLERLLGVALFRRTPAGVSLTPAGEMFLTDAYQVVASMSAAVDRARMNDPRLRGSVRVGFTAIATYSVLPTLFKLAGAYLPSISVRVTERISPQQVELAARGQLDIGFIRPQPLPADIVHTEISSDPVVVAMSPKHPLARVPELLTPGEIARYPVIRYEHLCSPYLAGLHDAVFAAHPARVAAEVSQVLSGIALCAEGFGSVLVPVSVTKIRVPGVVVRPVRLPAGHQRVPMWAIYSKTARGPLADRLLTLADELSTEIEKETSGLMRAVERSAADT